MSRTGIALGMVAMATIPVLLHGQQPFSLDPSFRATFNDWYVSSIYPQPDGKVILSGQMSFPGSEPFQFNGLTRLNADGTNDPSFQASNLGRGKITPWEDRFYVAAGLMVRRILLDGTNDNGYHLGTVQIPYFLPLQGGDYHVYEDGRILMSGAHQVNYPPAGWQGFYNLVWFTADGYLDTTRTPRRGDGVMYRFKELPDGKFICTGPMTVYDGHPTSNIFRVHADGALDTTFYTGVNWGQAFAYYPMENGACIVGGLFRIAGNPATFNLVRFLDDGNLDPTFNNGHTFNAPPPLSTPYGGVVAAITPLDDGRLVISGTFRDVDGIPRGSICLIDTAGQLLDDHFAAGGCGPHTYQGFTDAAIQDIIITDSVCYVWGDYHGYDDGTTNDPLQRFVTRLYGPALGLSVAPGPGAFPMQVYPNPSSGQATVALDELSPGAYLVVRDALGREVQRHRIGGHYTTLALEHAGVYLVELRSADNRLLKSEKLIVSP